MQDEAFKRAIEEIKARIPVEDVVRERVPGLRRTGALWSACCPFHEEKTPSFKVDPRRGTWHCFGACGTGGDQISFIQNFENVGFIEALEILATRAGVELPRRGRRDSAEQQREARLYAALEWARDRYARSLHGTDGAATRRYLDGRGLEPATIEAFHVGFAPSDGRALVGASGPDLEDLVAAGLARRTDAGRPYDFFRGRMMIPIADDRGRPVGFGARRLGDAESGPKYINTAETPLFRKSQLIYGLDLAREHVRRSGHLVLVEGYTDVMAAHQVGLRSVAAILGTSTTDEHARLVRRTGARRVTLVFDGDEAGGGATRKALAGLLPLELDLDIVRLPGGDDPCDWLLREGRDGFEARLEQATDWFSFALEGLAGLSGQTRLRGIDEVLALVARLPQALAREERLAELATYLDMPLVAVREAYEALAERRPAGRRARSGSRTPPAPSADSEHRADPPAEEEAHSRRERRARRRAYGELAGACLLDNSLVPVVMPHVAECPADDVGQILRAIRALHGRGETVIDAARAMTELGDSPARDVVVPLLEHAARAEDAQQLVDGALHYLERIEVDRSLSEGRRLVAEDADETAVRHRLAELHEQLRALKVPSASPGASHGT